MVDEHINPTLRTYSHLSMLFEMCCPLRLVVAHLGPGDVPVVARTNGDRAQCPIVRRRFMASLDRRPLLGRAFKEEDTLRRKVYLEHLL